MLHPSIFVWLPRLQLFGFYSFSLLLPPWSLLRTPVVGKVGPVFLTTYPTPAGAGGCQGQTTSVLFQHWHSPRPNESSLQGTDHLFSHGTSDCPPLSFLKFGEAQGWGSQALWVEAAAHADCGLMWGTRLTPRAAANSPDLGRRGVWAQRLPAAHLCEDQRNTKWHLKAAITVLCPSLVSSYETLAVVLGGRHSKSPMNERVLFWQLARYLINTISYMLLYSNRFVTLFAPIIY